MEIENFRIGNLVRSKQWGGTGVIVGLRRDVFGFELIVNGHVHKCHEGLTCDIEEIVLSEQMLLQLGFKESINGDFVLRETPIIFRIHRNLISGEFMCRINVEYSILVQTVNQLQNLFFSLTKRELRLNPVKRIKKTNEKPKTNE